MSQAQRWLLVFAAIWVGRALFAAPDPRHTSAPAWVGALVAILGMLVAWAETRGTRGAKMTERHRMATRWWVAAMTLQLLVSVAMMVTGAVLPRWFAPIAFFPLFAGMFVSAGSDTAERSSPYGNAMRLVILGTLGLMGLIILGTAGLVGLSFVLERIGHR